MNYSVISLNEKACNKQSADLVSDPPFRGPATQIAFFPTTELVSFKRSSTSRRKVPRAKIPHSRDMILAYIIFMFIFTNINILAHV